MRRLPSLLLVASVLAAAPLPGGAQQEPPVASWAFLQSVGGIKLGQPVKTPEGWQLPLECDLTGLRRITTDPTVLNSSQVIQDVQWRIEGDQLQLWLLLKPASYATAEARCPDLGLAGISPGTYEAVYREGEATHPLGPVNLQPR